MERWRGTLVATVGACALALGACGDDDAGSEADNYQSEIIRTVTLAEADLGLSSLATDLATTGESRSECADLMADFRSGLNTVADEVEGIEPPSDVAEPHAEVARLLRDGSEELADDEAAIEAGELECGEDLNDLIYGSPLRRQGERAIEEIEDAGYAVFGR